MSADWRDLNRAMWDAAVPFHLDSPVYDLPAFRAGGSSLRSHEIADLGDVAGKTLVHLQCHFGMDTLSWARRGARVTGVDFSAPAIAAATALAREIGVEARFVAADVYDAPQALSGERFDVVYTGVGALCWLPDMMRWARVVADLLAPGGRLYLYEFHPLKWIFGETATPEILDSYFTPAQGFPLGGVVYAGGAAPAPTLQWNHSLGEVVTALSAAGLRVTSLAELDSDVVAQWPMMLRGADGLYRMSPDRPALPLMYVLQARRDA